MTTKKWLSEFKIKDVPFGKFTVLRKAKKEFRPDFLERLFGFKPEDEITWSFLDRWGRCGGYADQPIEFDTYQEAELFLKKMKEWHQESGQFSDAQ